MSRLDDLIRINEEREDLDSERCKCCFTLLSKSTDFDTQTVISKCLEKTCKNYNVEITSLL